MQKKSCVILIVIMASALFLSCSLTRHRGKSSASLPGTWQTTPIVVDGDSKDWPSPYPNYDAKAKIAYATSNDDKNLYITMETGDQQTMFKILKQGMTIAIDTNGNKDGQFRINFPLPNDNEPFNVASSREGRSQMADKQAELKIKRMMESASQFSLEGFPGCSGGYMVSQTLPCGVKVRARMDEYKQLVWEACIPFKVVYGRDTLFPTDHGRPFCVGYIIKGFRNGGTKNGGGSGMNDGMGGAGTNSAMRVPDRSTTTSTNDPMQHLYETTKTWKQAGIVLKK